MNWENAGYVLNPKYSQSEHFMTSWDEKKSENAWIFRTKSLRPFLRQAPIYKCFIWRQGWWRCPKSLTKSSWADHDVIINRKWYKENEWNRQIKCLRPKKSILRWIDVNKYRFLMADSILAISLKPVSEVISWPFFDVIKLEMVNFGPNAWVHSPE